jgi:hypothetical protein
VLECLQQALAVEASPIKTSTKVPLTLACPASKLKSVGH